ncbi:hypothetical protein [Enterobacter hormaechei]|uniref:hypothetical protein n=1 Tax=Enterobacter hormaechei TaxID=158836 RepID=UPI0033156770
MEITTKDFADWLQIKEGELIYQYRTTGRYKGVKLPEPLYHQTGKTRKFRYMDVMKFMKKVQSREGKK